MDGPGDCVLEAAARLVERVLLDDAAEHVVAVVDADADADGRDRQRIDVHVDAEPVHHRFGHRLCDQRG